jgi:hypothetical protein
MSPRVHRDDAGRLRRHSAELSLYIALVIIAIAALTLAYLALSGTHLGGRPASVPFPDSTPDISESGGVEPVPASTAAVVGIVVSGSSPWWAESVGSGIIPGVSLGPQVGGAGVNTASLAAQIDEAVDSTGQAMVIQAGSQDIVEGATGDQIDAGIQALWQEVKDRGGRPIAALLSPSDLFPGSVTAVNTLIRTSAQNQGVAVLDMTSSVANPDGTWVAGLSDDGQEPNAAGVSLMAQAVAAQLPALLEDGSGIG